MILTMRVIIILIFANFTILVKATDQIPELIIVGRDTVFLFNFPLEEYRPLNIASKLDSFTYMNNNLCSPCNRAYQGVWELKDEKLFLNEIKECCYTQKYWITSYNIRVLKEVGVRIDILRLLEDNGLNKVYWDFQLKDLLKSKYKRKDVKKYLSIIYRYTENCEDRIDAGFFLSKNPREGSLFANWYSGKLYFEYKKVKYIFTVKAGNVIDKVGM